MNTVSYSWVKIFHLNCMHLWNNTSEKISCKEIVWNNTNLNQHSTWFRFPEDHANLQEFIFSIFIFTIIQICRIHETETDAARSR